MGPDFKVIRPISLSISHYTAVIFGTGVNLARINVAAVLVSMRTMT
jgi:hypothetical protein